MVKLKLKLSFTIWKIAGLWATDLTCLQIQGSWGCPLWIHMLCAWHQYLTYLQTPDIKSEHKPVNAAAYTYMYTCTVRSIYTQKTMHKEKGVNVHVCVWVCVCTWTTALEPLTSRTCPLRFDPSDNVSVTISAYLGNWIRVCEIYEWWTRQNRVRELHTLLAEACSCYSRPHSMQAVEICIQDT